MHTDALELGGSKHPYIEMRELDSKDSPKNQAGSKPSPGDYTELQGQIYCIGMFGFMVSFLLYAIGQLVYDPNSILFLSSALLQTVGGTLTIATTDLDPDLYFQRRRPSAILFAVLWIVFVVLFSLQGWPTAIGWMFVVLQSAPFVYLFIRPCSVFDMKPGFPTFVDLFVFSLVVYLFSQGVVFVLDAVSPPALDPEWPYCFLGVAAFVGAMVVAGTYLQRKHQGEIQRASASQAAVLVFLFSLGLLVLLDQSIDQVIYHGATHHWPAVTWLYGPVHLLSVPVVYLLRPKLRGWLGRRWLLQRLRRKGVQFSSSEKTRGSLTEVESAIADHSRDINGYLPLPRSNHDQCTLLIYASANGFLDAVEVLVGEKERRGVEVDRPSRERRQTALHLAAENGHTEVARCLIVDGNAPVDLADAAGYSPLYLAALSGRAPCVLLLLEHGARVTMDALLVAAGNGHTQVVDSLLTARDRSAKEGAASDGSGEHSTDSTDGGEEWAGLRFEDARSLYARRMRDTQQGRLFLVGMFLFALSFVCLAAADFLYRNYTDNLNMVLASSWLQVRYATAMMQPRYISRFNVSHRLPLSHTSRTSVSPYICIVSRSLTSRLVSLSLHPTDCLRSPWYVRANDHD
jgi:ankyrin repeat protein